MTREQFISFFFIALLIFVVYQIFLILAPFAQAIFWSAILAFAFYPAYARLRPHFKKNEGLAALVMTAIVFLLVMPPVVIVIVNVTQQAIDLYQWATAYIRDGGIESLIEYIRSLGWFKQIETQVFAWEPLKQNVTEFILNSSKAIGNYTATQATILTKNILLVALNVGLMTFLIFIFFKDGEEIYSFIYRITPLEEKNKKPIFRQINDTFSAVIRGQMVTSLAQAIITGLFFWVLGLPLPILVACLTFIAALVPISGAASVWLPFVIYLAATAQYPKAVALFVFGAFVISLMDNVLKPILIGEKTRLPYFLLFFGILGGLRVYGLVGIFLAPVVLSVFFSLVKIYQEKY